MAANDRPHLERSADDPRRPEEASPGFGSPDAPNSEARLEPVHIAEELRDLEKDDKTHVIKVFGVVLVAIVIIVGIFAYLLRPKPKATGAVEDAYAVALPGDNVLTTVKVSLQNAGGKALWIRNIKGKLVTADGNEYQDQAASASDFERYFQGYPDLRDHSLQALKVETMLRPGEQTRGSVILGFPVTLDTFNRRKSLSVTVEPYDQAAITLTK
jgi:hypothetical protein